MKYRIQLESNMGDVANLKVQTKDFEAALEIAKQWKRDNSKKYVDNMGAIIIFWNITEIAKDNYK